MALRLLAIHLFHIRGFDMSSPDTLNSIIKSIDNMTEAQYVFLLFKLGMIFLGILAAICGAAVGAYKAFVIVWSLVMRHIQQSLADSFSTPKQLKEALDAFRLSSERSLETFRDVSQAGFQSVLDRLAQGDNRMEKIEDRCWGRRRGEGGALCVSAIAPLSEVPHVG